MTYLMLREDLAILDQKIMEGYEEIKRIGREMGDACRQSGETWHDNFAFEEGQRLMSLWQCRMQELNEIRSNVVVAEPSSNFFEVGFGRKVHILDLDTEEMSTYKIGSYITFTEDKEVISISYDSPLAQLIMGAKYDEIREGEIGGSRRRYRVIMVF